MCNGIFFEMVDILFLVCEIFEDFFEWVDFKRGEVFVGKFGGLCWRSYLVRGLCGSEKRFGIC